jgi:putative copper resistance protein D
MMVLLVWLHLLAAITWIGGMLFLSVVLVPVLKQESFMSQRTVLFRIIAWRFRTVVWGAIAVLLLTGPLLLSERGIPIADPSGWPGILATKLGLVAMLLILILIHDFILGPRIARTLQVTTGSRTRLDHTLAVWSSWIARFSLMVALAILFAAVILART